MTLRPLEQDDINPLAAVLARAFSEDPGMRYVVPDQDDWNRIATTYFARTLRHTIEFGHGLVDRELRGLSLWETTGAHHSVPRQLWELTRTVLLFRRNLVRAMPLHATASRHRPRRPFWYLTYIATDPAHQGSGVGSTLLEPMLELANRQRLPVFLECSNRHNLSFYINHGFNIIDEIRLPQGPSIWPMLRESR